MLFPTFPLPSTIIYAHLCDQHWSKQFRLSVFSGWAFSCQTSWSISRHIRYRPCISRHISISRYMTSEKGCKPKGMEHKEEETIKKKTMWKEKRNKRKQREDVWFKKKKKRGGGRKGIAPPALVSHIWTLDCLIQIQTGLYTAPSVW